MLSPAARRRPAVPSQPRASRLAQPDAAIVRRVRSLRDAPGEADEIVLDGPHLFYEALVSRTHLSGVWFTLTARRREGPALERALQRATTAGVPTHEVSDRTMDRLSPAKTPSGVLTLGRRPQWTDTSLWGRDNPLIVIAAAVQEPGNVGAIVRVTEAAGGTGVWFCDDSADPWSWRALRGSMGSSLRLPVLRRGSLDDALRAAEIHGVSVVAADADGATDLHALALRGATAFLVGSEGGGLPRSVLDRCATTVRIPMAAPVDSLNVATATALLVYEARRQRTPPIPPAS